MVRCKRDHVAVQLCEFCMRTDTNPQHLRRDRGESKKVPINAGGALQISYAVPSNGAIGLESTAHRPSSALAWPRRGGLQPGWPWIMPIFQPRAVRGRCTPKAGCPESIGVSAGRATRRAALSGTLETCPVFEQAPEKQMAGHLPGHFANAESSNLVANALPCAAFDFRTVEADILQHPVVEHRQFTDGGTITRPGFKRGNKRCNPHDGFLQ